jgi:hypothetical protein
LPGKKRHARRVLRQGACHEHGSWSMSKDGRKCAEKPGMFDNSAIGTYHLRLPLFESGRKGAHGQG